MTIFFTAYTHFGHQNIIRHCKRPWKSAQEMNEELQHRWNAIVGPHDTVYHLGDLGFGNAKRMEPLLPLLRSLRGKKRLVPGNHDSYGALTSYQGIFEILPALTEISSPARISLCHYPMMTWNRSHHGSYMFHGHSHGVFFPASGRFDVGVDAWNYKPVAFEELEEYQRLFTEQKMRVFESYPCWGFS